MFEETPLKNRFDTDEMSAKVEMMKAEISLPKLSFDNIQVLIDNLSNAQFRKGMSPASLSDASLELALYSLALTTYENRINSYYEWCEKNIQFIVGKELDNTPGYGFEEKNIKIRSTNHTALELEEKKLSALVKKETIKWLSQKIQFLSDRLDKLSIERRKERYI